MNPKKTDMNLREQFKKETGESATDWRMGSPVLHPHYVQWLEHRNKEQVEVLKRADQFISNGIEYGYITMPDEETGDSATETPKLIEEQLKKSE